MRDKIVIITGSFNPDICGVGDYTEKLFLGLKSSKSAKLIDLLVWRDWSFMAFWKQYKEIKKKYTTVHLQYPTEGYGYSLYPILLFFLLRSKTRIVTLHEYSQRTNKARWATTLFFYCSDHIIFTTEEERNLVIKKFSAINTKSSVINIASNIASPKEKINWNDRKYDVAYFGHIRPNKGIEDFIQQISISQSENKNTKFIIVGQIQKRFIDYSKSLFSMAHSQNIEYFLDSDDKNVSQVLQNSKILYLPFPDGISMRRGSFLAGIENDCLIISNKGDFDLGLDKYAVLFDIHEPESNRFTCIQNILKEEVDCRNIRSNVEKFRKLINWDTIVSKHITLYEK